MHPGLVHVIQQRVLQGERGSVGACEHGHSAGTVLAAGRQHRRRACSRSYTPGTAHRSTVISPPHQAAPAAHPAQPPRTHQLLALRFAHILPQQLVTSALVLADAPHLGLHTHLLLVWGQRGKAEKTTGWWNSNHQLCALSGQARLDKSTISPIGTTPRLSNQGP